MKKIKNIVLMIILLFIWIVLYLFVVNKDKIANQKSVSQYILINQFTCWRYTNSKWTSLSYATDEFNTSKELNWKKYDIYIQNQYYKTLDYVVKDGKEFYFDDNTHSYEINDEKIMFNKGSYLKLKDFNQSELTSDDEVIIGNILNKYKISDENLTVKDKYVIENDAALYVVSNYTGSYPVDSKNMFSLVFYRKNNINYVLIKNGFIEHVNSYRLAFVVDAKNKFDNFIISATCESGPCYWMYEYHKGKYTNMNETV